MFKFIIANWKMNFGVKQSVSFIKQFTQKYKNQRAIVKRRAGAKIQKQVVICPSFVALDAVGKLLKNSKIALGAQNVAQAEKGTWTGEVSVEMLKEIGCKYVITGHSERRRNLAETDEQINAKIKLVIRNNIIPILCVGETREERKHRLTNKIIARQVKKGLNDVVIPSIRRIGRLIIAYEPIWAISDGKHSAKIPAIEEIEKVHKLIFNILNKNYSTAVVKEFCQVIYGGSVNSKNIVELFASDYIHGGLIGGASLNVGEFNKMIKLG